MPRVFYSADADAVKIETAPPGAQFSHTLSAYADGPGISIQDTNKARLHFYQVPYDSFTREDDSPAGADVTQTVDYLNGEFARDPLAPPVIVSSLNVTAYLGTTFNYTILTTGGSPTNYGASGLPPGLYLNQRTGHIQGTPTTTVGSPFTVSIAAINGAGVDQQTLTLTVTTAPAFPNIRSLLLLRGSLQHAVAVAPAAHFRDAGDPWTHSFWIDRGVGGDGAVYANVDATDAGVRITKESANRIHVYIQDSAGGLIHVRDGGIAATWQHVFADYDGSGTAAGVNLYYDNVLQPLTVLSDNLTGALVPGQDSYIGRAPNDLAGDYLDAHFDELAMYDIVLSGANRTAVYAGRGIVDLNVVGAPASLISWYRAGDGDTFPVMTDNSPNSNHMTLVNCTVGSFTNNVP